MRRNASAKSAWLWLAGLAAILTLHFWFPQLARRPMNDTYSVEPEGKKAFFLLMQRRFAAVTRNNLSPAAVAEEMNDDDVFCLLGPSRYPDNREWELLLDWVRRGGSLIVAPQQGDPSLKIEELEIQVEPLVDVGLDLGEMLKQAQEHDPGEAEHVTTTLFDGGELRWQSLGKITGDGGQVLVELNGEPQAVLKSYGAGQVLLLATDEIFSNKSLTYKDNGVLAQRLVESVAPPRSEIVFDEYFNTIGAPKVVGLLFDPLLRPLTVQALALLLLYLWFESRRFGRSLPRSQSSRHDIADHTDALGNMYYRTGDGATAVRYYYEQFRMDLQLKYLSLTDARAVETLARRAGWQPEEVQELLQSADAAMKDTRTKRRVAGDIIRRLAELRAGIREGAARSQAV